MQRAGGWNHHRLESALPETNCQLDIFIERHQVRVKDAVIGEGDLGQGVAAVDDRCCGGAEDLSVSTARELGAQALPYLNRAPPLIPCDAAAVDDVFVGEAQVQSLRGGDPRICRECFGEGLKPPGLNESVVVDYRYEVSLGVSQCRVAGTREAEILSDRQHFVGFAEVNTKRLILVNYNNLKRPSALRAQTVETVEKKRAASKSGHDRCHRSG
jgi:hypothetical protein